MCVVDIKVNEAVVKSINPDLNDILSIRRWVQEVVDRHIESIMVQRDGTMEIEAMREQLHQMVKEVYSRP